MSLGLVEIGIIALAAVIVAALPAQWRGWAILAGSVVGIYWLQPQLAPRWANYFLPSATLALAIAGWWVSGLMPRDAGATGSLAGDPPSADSPSATSSGFAEDRRITQRAALTGDDRWTLLVVVALMLGWTLWRYIPTDWRIIAGRPPSPAIVGGVIAVAGLLFMALAAVTRRLNQRAALSGGIVAILALFVVAKWAPATTLTAGWWRGRVGQDAGLAAPSDLMWLGFAYVALRVIHTLRDRQMNILPAMSLRAYLSYILFLPAFVAGPIDRAQRFVADYDGLDEQRGFDAHRWGTGLWRIGEGLFKKFVIADMLAQGLSLTPRLAAQTDSPLALWLLLFGYGLRIYFDFSGYTDIAIGLGMLAGIRLPENFNRPYTRSNITTFWQSWHISLSDWARNYIFTPLSRALLRRRSRAAAWLTPTVIVLAAHLATMIAIGLWHSITWNFFIWGVWHGVGLFIHKRWSDRTRFWYRGLRDKPLQRRAWAVTGWAITVLFVMLGWVWFLLPTPQLALATFARLFAL